LLTTPDPKNFHFFFENNNFEESISSLHEFYSHLVEFSSSVGGYMLSVLMTDLKPLLMTAILEQKKTGMKNTSANLSAVFSALSVYLSVFQTNFLNPPLSQQFFEQVSLYIDAILFNEVLLRREFCSFTKGAEIKMNINTLTDWMKRQGKDWLGTSASQLNHIEQAVNFLLLGNKKIVLEENARKDICGDLNVWQLKQLMTMYVPSLDVGEDRIPYQVVQALVAQDPNASETEQQSLLLDSNKRFFFRLANAHFIELDNMTRIVFPPALFEALMTTPPSPPPSSSSIPTVPLSSRTSTAGAPSTVSARTSSSGVPSASTKGESVAETEEEKTKRKSLFGTWFN